MKAGLIFRKGSFWVGAHWSPYNRRWCINFLPCVTFWIALEGGRTPPSDAQMVLPSHAYQQGYKDALVECVRGLDGKMIYKTTKGELVKFDYRDSVL